MGRGPRIRVSVCICDKDRILLVQHTKGDHSYWLLPGGGLEYGETLEETARREVFEETGVNVKIERLILVCEAIQPGGRHNLEMVFRGHAMNPDELKCGEECISDCGWIDREAFAEVELHPPIARQIESCWKDEFGTEVMVLGNVWQDHPGH